MSTAGNNKKKILLIRTDFWESDKFNHPMHFTPPITLKYAGALLNRAGGYDVEIIDCCVDKISAEELISEILHRPPLAVVIFMSSFSYGKSRDLAAAVKDGNNKIFIISVGHGVVSRPQEYLSVPEPFDIILKGEAEHEIADAIQKLADSANLEEIKQCYSRENAAGVPILSYQLNSLPFPDYTPAELRKYTFIYPLRLGKRILSGYIISSRGCRHSCIFCTQAVRRSYSKEVRFRSASNVVDEIERLIRMKVNLIYFMDDNLSTSREHLISICKEIMGRGLNINWVASPRIDELEYHLLKMMKEAGCLLLLLSVESGSSRIIRLLNKTQDPDRWLEKTRGIFSKAKELGIETCALFMVGNPSETEDEIEESIRLAKELNPDSIKVHFFTPYPGTEIYEKVKELVPAEDLDLMHHYLPPVVNLTGMDMKRLRLAQLYFYKRFLFRAGYIIRHFAGHFWFYLHNPRAFRILLAFIFKMLRNGLNKRNGKRFLKRNLVRHAKLKRNYKKIARTGLLFNLLRTVLFKTSHPTVVSWCLTNRCNQRCLYCRLWSRETPELGTKEILTTIDRLFQAGVRYAIFTGGEPLLRDDIEEIMTHAYKKGMYVVLNTNGRLLSQKSGCLKNLDELGLSLDGPEEINDRLKRKGNFRYTVGAIELAKKRAVPVSLATVLSRDNLECVDFLLAFAKRHNLKIGFQPAALTYLGTDQPSPFIPPINEYRQAISYLLRAKAEGNKHIINSITGLRHIYSFPSGGKLSCLAGRFMFRLWPNGDVSLCHWGLRTEGQRMLKLEDILGRNSTGVNSCNSCRCYYAVELNLIGSFKFEPMLNAIRGVWG